MPGHERIRDQEGNGAGDVFGFADAAGRCFAGEISFCGARPLNERRLAGR
jgi:hypothetical protein